MAAAMASVEHYPQAHCGDPADAVRAAWAQASRGAAANAGSVVTADGQTNAGVSIGLLAATAAATESPQSAGVPIGVLAALRRRASAQAQSPNDAASAASLSATGAAVQMGFGFANAAGHGGESGMDPVNGRGAEDEMQQMQHMVAARHMQMGAEGEREPVMDEQQFAAVQQEVTFAQQTQYLQQCQFQAQMRQYENARTNNTGKSTFELPSRFKTGFRPMQLCRKLFRQGHCPRGDDCTFAHVAEELHPAAPEFKAINGNNDADLPPGVGTESLAQQAVEAPPTSEPAMRMKKKREMCQRLGRGGCLLGKKCMFAHTESELGTVALVITDRVKTSICKFWENDKCIYGKYCVNAHGMEEIGQLKPPEDLSPPMKMYKSGDAR